MYSVLDKLILYSFLIFLDKVPEFLNFLTGLVLFSCKPVSYKNIFSLSFLLFCFPSCKISSLEGKSPKPVIFFHYLKTLFQAA